MRKIKYVLAVLLLTVASIFVSEFYTFHLENFQGKYANTTFYKPADTSDLEMNKEIQEAADAYEVKVFSVNREIHSTIRSDITVYGNEEVIEALKKDGLLFQNNRSLFLGTVHVESQPYAK